MHVAVLGAGIAGVATAYELCRAGHSVEVFDRQPAAAQETSMANGGVIGGTQVEPWAKPGLPRKLVSWIGREDAPLLIRPAQIPHMWSWGIRFLASCTAARAARTIAANTRLTRYSLDRFAALRAQGIIGGAAYDFGNTGATKVYWDGAAFAAARADAAVIAANGIAVETLACDECVRREPALAHRRDAIAGALFFPAEEIGDCHKFTTALATVCEGLGAKFRFGRTVRGLDVRDGRAIALRTDDGPAAADAFVVAAASSSQVLLGRFGARLPVIPVKGVTVTVPARRWKQAVRGAVMDHSRLFGLIRIGDRLRIAGSAEITGHDTVPSRDRCKVLVNNVLSLFPDFQACLDDAEPMMWAGVRANTPDGMPVLGATPLANVYLNTGHGPQGWSTAMGCARAVADIVGGRSPAIDIRPYALTRW